MKTERLILIVLFALLASGFTERVPARTADVQRGPVRITLDEADPNAIPSLIMHDIGNVRMTFSNRGATGNPDGTTGFTGFEYPFGSGNDFLFSGGIWVGARINGIKYVSTTMDGDNGTIEFWPVHIGTVPSGNPSGDWFVASNALTQHQNRSYVYGARGLDDDGDWTFAHDLNGDSLPSANWDAGKGLIGIDDDGDGLIDEDSVAIGTGAPQEIDADADGNILDTGPSGDHNYDGRCGYDPEPRLDEDPAGDISHDHVDNDHDGLMDMSDPDYDGDTAVGSNDDDGDGLMDEDGNARGYQEYFAVFQDDIELTYVHNPNFSDGHTPLHIEITQRTYTWPGGLAQDFVLCDYEIRNVGEQALDSVFVALFADPDIAAAGEHGDAASTDDYNYYDPARKMAVQYDNPYDQDGWGPGVFAMQLIRTPVPLQNLRVTFYNFERISGGDPVTNAEFYNTISSNYVAPPSPRAGDWRMAIGFGSQSSYGFQLAPGEMLPITVAYIGAPDTTSLRITAEQALQVYYMDNVPLSPQPPANFRLMATGPGMIQLAWCPVTGTIAGYNVFGKANGGTGAQTQFNTALISDTTFLIMTLENGADWLMRCQAVDTSGREGLFAELLVRVAAPQPVTGLLGEVYGDIVVLEWNVSPETNITGYRVLRVTDSTDSTLFAVTDNHFTDATARQGYVNSYRAAAVNDLGVSSFWCGPVELTPFAPQRRILVIDQTASGQYGCVSQDSVRLMYVNMLNGIGEDYDYRTGAASTALDSMADYDMVLWIAENPRSDVSNTREQSFTQYRRAGGKMIRIARSFMDYHLGYPTGMHYGPFTLLSPLTFDSIFISHLSMTRINMQSVGANPEFNRFPQAIFDTARLRLLNWPGGRVLPFLPDVDVFWPQRPTSPLYRMIVLPTDTSGFGDQPCAVIGEQMIVLAFPLYFLRYETARDILHECIDTLRGIPYTPSNLEKLPSPSVSRLLPNYPNPFNSSTTIHYELRRSGHVRLAVYNLIGQEVCVLSDQTSNAGEHFVVWNGTNNRGTTVGSGIYFVRMDAPDGAAIKKIILLR